MSTKKLAKTKPNLAKLLPPGAIYVCNNETMIDYLRIMETRLNERSIDMKNRIKELQNSMQKLTAKIAEALILVQTIAHDNETQKHMFNDLSEQEIRIKTYGKYCDRTNNYTR